MTKSVLILLTMVGGFALSGNAAAQNPHLVVYAGDQCPGRGKHIVFLAGDHEYRSEETLPALARILAKHYISSCTLICLVNQCITPEPII